MMDYSKLTKEQIINGIKNKSINFIFLPIDLKNDKEIVLEAVRKTSENLDFASQRLKDDKEVVLEAVKKVGLSLINASDRLKDDKDIVLEAVKKRVISLKYASDRLQNDKELLELLEKGESTISYNDDKKWYKERMDILDNIREKELIDSFIKSNNKNNKKIKF